MRPSNRGCEAAGRSPMASSKPYAKDNVQLVVYMYNVCKAEFAHKDVVKFCRAVAAMEAEIA